MSALSDRYTLTAVRLHWILAVLILAQLFVGWMFHEVIEGPARGTWFEWHKALGISILLITLVRVGWRLTHRPPPFPAAMAGWERMAARLTHFGLYFIMLALPLTGYGALSTGRRSLKQGFVSAFGGLHFPLLPFPPGWHEWFEESHGYLVTATWILLALHIGAVLKHAFIDRDTVPSRMLTFLRSR